MTHKESLASHLLELRSRLIRILICFGFLALVGIPFSSDIYTFAASPLLEILPSGSSMIATQVTSPLMAPLKLVFFSALLITMPYLFYEMWMFMSPGLYKKEKVNIYKKLDIDIFGISAKNNTNIVEIKEFMEEKCVVFVGNSGAGKSTLTNCLTGKDIIEIPLSDVIIKFTYLY